MGIKTAGLSKAYDWNDLLKNYFIQDTLGKYPVLLVLENDTSSFHAYSRVSKGKTLFFTIDKDGRQLSEAKTLSVGIR